MDFKKFLPWIIGIGAVLIIAFWVIGVKNSGLRYSQATEKAWGDVQTFGSKRC